MRKQRYQRLLSLFLTLVLLLSAPMPSYATEQGGSGDSTGTGTSDGTGTGTGDSTGTGSDIEIKLDQSSAVLEPDGHIILKATVTPAADVTWETDTTGIIVQDGTTSENNTISYKGIKAGDVNVRACVGERKSEPCKITVSGITVEADTQNLEVGDKATLTMTAYGKAKELDAASWRWVSESPDVASVQPDGATATIEAKASGDVTIRCDNTASGVNYKASCVLKVKAKSETGADVTLSQTAMVLSPGQTGTLSAESSANPEDIKWSMGDTKIATVSPATGKEVTITGVATGETRVMVQAGGGVPMPCTIVVSGIAFASDPITVTAGKSVDVTVITYGDSKDVAVSSWEWQSGDSSIASVAPTSAGGTVRGIQAGETTLTVTVGEYQASCKVNVEHAQSAMTIGLSEATITLAPGTSARLRANTLADSTDIEWEIANPDIVTLAGRTGYTIVLAAGETGQTTITAKVGDSDPATCTVVVSGVTLSETSLEMTVNGMHNLILTTFGDAQAIPSWEWSSSNTGVAIVTQNSSGGQVRAVGAGTSTITCRGGSYFVLCEVSVSANEAAAIEAKLTDGILKFSSYLTDLKTICKTMTEEELSYITNVSVNPKYGTLYEGYVSEGDTGFGVASNQNYYVESAAHLISSITFVPKADVNTTVRISYDGFTPNNRTFTGSILVPVGQQENTLAYASLNGAPVHFRSEDFFNYSMSVYNRSLQYLTFTMPATRYGTLYYSYVDANVYEHIVSGGTRYYRTYSPNISNVAFVPNPSYSGAFSIQFTGYDTEGAAFTGTVRISVNNPNGSDISETLRERLHYETGPGARVHLDADDFIDECKEQTGYSLVSVEFESLPKTSVGQFYIGRSNKLKEETEYSVRQLGDINFVAHKNYTGSFEVPFTANTDKDTVFSGEVYMTVSQNGAYLIRMSATSGNRLYLSVSDFSDISKVATQQDFHHISFQSMPSTGVLHYNNGSDRVTPYTLYYRTGSEPFVSNINYLSPDTFSGEVRIPYNLWNTEGKSITGHLLIRVERPGMNLDSSASSPYSTGGPAIPIRAADIITPAQKEIGNVSTIHFTPPSPSSGKLLLNYTSPGLYSTFDSTRDYSPETLGNIYFLPKAGFKGTATVTYLARNVYNKVYSGILRIQVLPPERSAYFTDLTNRAWAVPAVDFFRYYNVLNGTTPTTYEPDGAARRGAYITVLGRMYHFPSYPGTGGYDDVELNFYYTPYIAAGRALGITEAAQYFHPGEAITRQDAAVYLYRCLNRAGQAPEAPITNLSKFKDGYLISYYAVEAMSSLVEMGVFQGTEDGYLNPYATLTRLQMAAILHRAMT